MSVIKIINPLTLIEFSFNSQYDKEKSKDLIEDHLTIKVDPLVFNTEGKIFVVPNEVLKNSIIEITN